MTTTIQSVIGLNGSDMSFAATLLAHQGGWDEILWVAGPIVVIVAVLAVVKRRVDAQHPTDDP